MGDSEFITQVLTLLNGQRHLVIGRRGFWWALIYSFCTGHLLSFFDLWGYGFQQIYKFSNILYSSIYFVPSSGNFNYMVISLLKLQGHFSGSLPLLFFLPLSLWVSF